MSLTSYNFIFLFLPATVSGYFLLLYFKRWAASEIWLLLSSIAFYACASLRSLAIVMPSILFDFAIAKAFLRFPPSNVRGRTALIGVGIATNILFLGYFKYCGFLSGIVDVLLDHNRISIAAILPLGISFLTFQKIAFLCDLAAGQITEVTLFQYLLFTLFFPRTIAGPIVHYQQIIPQLKQSRLEDVVSNIAVGFCLFSIGLFKKCIIADNIAMVANNALNLFPTDRPAAFVDAWTGVPAYTFQLYFDFSGYSDMALGVARMVGVRLPMNFNSPLKATSIVDFWSRWHITLTQFLTWYIYIPLVRRLTQARAAQKAPLLRGPKSTPSAVAGLIGIPTGITMLISGIWHGVGWTFVVWGLLHGLYLTINQAWRLWRPRFWKNSVSYERVMRPVGFVLTFGAVMLGLVFFRADSLDDALSILAGMVGLHGFAPHLAQVVGKVGYPFDWTVLYSPWSALTSLIILFGVTTLCPNSLELMRRFQPALDFPEAAQQTMSAPTAHVGSTLKTDVEARTDGTLHTFQRGWAMVKHIAQTGLSLNRLTATMIGLLFVLGAMAIGHTTQFLYGAF